MKLNRFAVDILSVLDVLLESVLRRFYLFALSNAVVLINTMLKALLDDDWHIMCRRSPELCRVAAVISAYFMGGAMDSRRVDGDFCKGDFGVQRGNELKGQIGAGFRVFQALLKPVIMYS